MIKKTSSLSIVIPVYNDQEVLPELYKRLKPVIDKLTDNYEIILVDDGSKDNSWNEILQLKKQDENIVAVKLARNFGQQNSIAAGLDISQNEIVVLMDSDLQDRPEDIPLLINALVENDCSMAIAQWETRKDSAFKLFVSKLFYQISNRITSIHTKPSLGVFRAMKREVVLEMKNFPERTATTLSILYFIGTNYVTVPLKRDARYAGKSGYNLSKMLSMTFARIFSFSMFPIRLATYIGFSISGISFVLGIVLVIRRILGLVAPGWTSTIVLILFLFGLNFAFLGILGEYIGKIFLETKQRPKYIIGRIIKK
ncbi:MAG TPA: glycosyltransferase family 2 protein [Salinivirgaceae bacterium]|nr:glycosyltransferase family 2 protein [Salinivirgaceae bacterium]HQA75499.1 glycosyltransferase family 2 protein [Salinivirgaceae bacterium]